MFFFSISFSSGFVCRSWAVMEGMLSSSEQERLVSSFLEIAVGQTSETARQFLEVRRFCLFLVNWCDWSEWAYPWLSFWFQLRALDNIERPTLLGCRVWNPRLERRLFVFVCNMISAMEIRLSYISVVLRSGIVIESLCFLFSCFIVFCLELILFLTD